MKINNYVIAIQFEGGFLSMHKVSTEQNKSQALKKFLVDICKSEQSKKEQREWNKSIPNDYKELKYELYAQGQVDVEVMSI